MPEGDKIVTISMAPEGDMRPDADVVHENDWYNQEFDGYQVDEHPIFEKRPIRMVCVGAGATGLQIAYKAERVLKKVTLQIYEKNGDVGGTWLENRYPGCTCDIPSHSYQFTWAKNPNWSAYYSSSPEIWQYFKDVATKYQLEKYVAFNHTIESATWNEEMGQWILSVIKPDGSRFEDHCEVLVNGSGVLNSWKLPNIPGVDLFKGKIMHSAKWDSEYDLKGKTVAVIGGGSSAVQIVPSIQPIVAKLIPFLRSPVWITTGFGAKYAGPGGTNFDYPEEQIKEFNANPEEYTQYCRDVEGELNKRFTLESFPCLSFNFNPNIPQMHLKANDQKTSRDLVTKIMSERLNNPDLANHMIPKFALGCRRMTPGSGYLESLSAPNVKVVTSSAVRMTENAIVDEEGNEHIVDVVVFATGFDTSFTPHFKVTGRNGADIHEQFGDFPKAYLGITAPNFPNLFLLVGPNSPTSHSSILPIMEWYTRYFFQFVEKMQRENIKAFDPKPAAVQELYYHTHELMKRLVWSSACRSWFKNGKTHGPVTAIWPGSRLHFFEMLKTPRYEDYDITYRTSNRFAFCGNGYTETELDPEGDPVWYFDDEFTKV